MARIFAASSWTALTYLPLAIYFHEHVAQPMWVTGISMYPFFNADFDQSLAKDVVLVDMRSPWKDLKRGMVVAFRSPTHPERLLIKRVIGLPGDTVTPRPSSSYPFAQETVPPGSIWVEGENPEERWTRDSNTYGPVPANLLVGKAKAVVWPWRRRGMVRWEDWKGSPRVRVGGGDKEAEGLVAEILRKTDGRAR